MSSSESILVNSFYGGISGAGAMTLQVTSLMWMRTTMNYQYKNGGGFSQTLKNLYKEGGVLRFYRGYLPALMIGPISRFGDTFVNTLSLEMFNSRFAGTPLFIQTMGGSVLAGLWRISTLPIDAWKTSKQVHGKEGINVLKNKYQLNGIRIFYAGAVASSLATMVGHYPWFVTYNYLNAYLPKYKFSDEALKALGRNALIGFTATAISDTVSNSIRVVKTVKQTHPEKISYSEAVKSVVAKDGWRGLFLRGLETKILTNGVQGIIFSVGFKFFQERLGK